MVLVDDAGGHVAGGLKVPPDVRPFHLPPCTPELQPAEHLWPLVREALANRGFDHPVGLAAELRRRCGWLAEHPEVVKGGGRLPPGGRPLMATDHRNLVWGEEAGVLVRELVGGDPPHTCKVIFLDHPTGFGHRVVDDGRVVEHVLTRHAEFEAAVAGKLAEGFAETGRSLTRRVFVAGGMFWVVALDGDAVRTRFGKVRADWRESAGEARDREYRDRDRAVAAYHRAVADKEAEGYREVYPRPVSIPAAPAAPRKPGRRKSR